MKLKHIDMDQFPVVQNELQIGGIGVSRLASRVGTTPFYAYDRQLISERVDLLRQVLPERLHLHYAIKANPMPAVVQHLSHIIDGFDIASAGEMKTALDTPMPANRISFAGPGKTVQELKQAIASNVIINVESENELKCIDKLAELMGSIPCIAIRVNPNYKITSSGMKMGSGPMQFGIDEEDLPRVLSSLDKYNVNFHGLHIFWGSQNLNEKAIQQAQTKTFQLALKLAEYCPTPIKLLNIGGGLGIPYFPGEQRLKLEPIADNLNYLLENFRSERPETTVATELGRYIVGEAGIYVCKIVDRKKSRGQTFLITDGGLHHHLAATGNFGQVLRKNFPVGIGNKMAHHIKESVKVVGPLCTPLDLLADKAELPQGEIGDLIVIFQSGAYGYSASPRLFLSHPECPEILV